MRMGALTAALTAVVLLGVVPASGHAQPAACREQAGVHVCQTDGYGTILNNDVAQARDEALIDARRRALEGAVGVQIDAETITRNQALFDQSVRARTGGLVQAERVLEEAPTTDGRFRVRLECWVKATAVQERVAQMVSNLSFVVLVPERNLDAQAAQPVIENEIVRRLTGEGFRVLDARHVERLARRDQLDALERGDDDAARAIGRRFLANLIVVGQATSRPSQNTGGIVSAHANVTVRVIEADTGRIVANVALDRVRGFAAAPEAAGQDALHRAAAPVGDDLVKRLDGYFKRSERRIDVVFRGLPGLDEYRRAKAFLEAQRWVTGVTESAFTREQATIELKYPEKTLYLATRLGREARYRVVEAEHNRILVEYRP